jgi:hypothetical protein
MTGKRSGDSDLTLSYDWVDYLERVQLPQNLMMKCAEALTYPEFYQAFHASRWPFN